MLNLFGRKPEHPLAKIFSGTSIDGKCAIVCFLHLVGSCDSPSNLHVEEEKMMTFYLQVFDLTNEQASAYFGKTRGLFHNSLNSLSRSQKEMLVSMAHGMACADGKPNETELNFLGDTFESIGISADDYIAIVLKGSEISKTL